MCCTETLQSRERDWGSRKLGSEPLGKRHKEKIWCIVMFWKRWSLLGGLPLTSGVEFFSWPVGCCGVFVYVQVVIVLHLGFLSTPTELTAPSLWRSPTEIFKTINTNYWSLIFSCQCRLWLFLFCAKNTIFPKIFCVDNRL